VEQGKGRKDRYTLLSNRLLEELRTYWKVYRPESWLFFSKTRDCPMCPTSIQSPLDFIDEPEDKAVPWEAADDSDR
jgi:integrase